MVYDGNNYAIQHSPLFYICFVAAMITATALMLGLFLIMVGRASAATKAAGPAPATAPDAVDGRADDAVDATVGSSIAAAPATTAPAPVQAA